MKRSLRLPVGRLTGLFVVAAVTPLALLTYFSVTLAGDAVRREVERRMSSSAALSAQVARQEMTGLATLVESYAKRPSLEERERLRERSVSLLEKSSYSAAELRRLVRRAVAQ